MVVDDGSPDETADVARRFRRDVVIALGGFREELRACEDRDFYIRLAQRYPIHCHHEIVAEYRRHGMQMSHNWATMLKYGLAVLRSQRRHVSRHPQYRDAYRDGISSFQQTWGEPVAWEMVRSTKRREWAAAARAFVMLAWLYPYGFIRLLESKMAVPHEKGAV